MTSRWILPLLALASLTAQGGKIRKHFFKHDGQDVEVSFNKDYLNTTTEDLAKRNKMMAKLLKKQDKLTVGQVIEDLRKTYGVHVYDAGNASALNASRNADSAAKELVMNRVAAAYFGTSEPEWQLTEQMTNPKRFSAYLPRISTNRKNDQEKRRLGLFKFFRKRRHITHQRNLPLNELNPLGYFWQKLARSGLKALDVTVGFVDHRGTARENPARRDNRAKRMTGVPPGGGFYRVIYPLQHSSFLIPHPVILIFNEARMPELDGLLRHAPLIHAYNLMVEKGMGPRLEHFGDTEPSEQLLAAALMANSLIYQGALSTFRLAVPTEAGTVLPLDRVLTDPTLKALTLSLVDQIRGV